MPVLSEIWIEPVHMQYFLACALVHTTYYIPVSTREDLQLAANRTYIHNCCLVIMTGYGGGNDGYDAVLG